MKDPRPIQDQHEAASSLVDYENQELIEKDCEELETHDDRVRENNKDLVPKVFGELLCRYEGMTGGYTQVYRIPPRQIDSAKMGIVEFVANNLPQLLPSEKELRRLKLEKLKEKAKSEVPPEGTPV